MIDQYGRQIEYLRISVTDRCNERCLYCMPEEGVPLVTHEDVLTFDEIVRLTAIAAGLGLHRIRLTGGEPLLRRGLADLVRELKALDGVDHIALTTNGTRLASQLDELVKAGLNGVNLSLDTCDPALYHRITRIGDLRDALAGLDAAAACPEITTKVDCVLLGLPEQKLTDIASLSRDRLIHTRFIELMPIGMGKEAFLKEHDGPLQRRAAAQSGDVDETGCGEGCQFVPPLFRYVSLAELRERLEAAFGPLSYLGQRGHEAGEAGRRHSDDELTRIPEGGGPAIYYRIDGFAGRIGMIGAVSQKFCDRCNRVRLTAQGYLKACLQYDSGADLKGLLRSGAPDEEIRRVMEETIFKKPKEHSFLNETIEHEESKTMSAIGG